MQSKRDIGNDGENIAKEYYQKNGFELLEQNYTIRGGEIDIILKNDDLILFVEVKVINNTNDIFGYISQKKLNFVHKTIQHYIQKNNIDKDYRLDAVFIKDSKIYEIYENLSF